MSKKKKFKGQSKLKGRDAATGLNVKKNREEVEALQLTVGKLDVLNKNDRQYSSDGMKTYFDRLADSGAVIKLTPSDDDLVPTPPTEFGEIKDPAVIGIDPGTGSLGYIKLSDIKNVSMKPGTPEYERNTASRPIVVTEANALEDSATKALGNAVGSKFGRARPTINSGPIFPLPNADYDMDLLNPTPIRIPAIRGISTFLTPAEIDSLHRGDFVLSGGYEKLSSLSKTDPIFYAVRGEPEGTVIANSKGGVLLPNIKIPLGRKFDYRF